MVRVANMGLELGSAPALVPPLQVLGLSWYALVWDWWLEWLQQVRYCQSGDGQVDSSARTSALCLCDCHHLFCQPVLHVGSTLLQRWFNAPGSR